MTHPSGCLCGPCLGAPWAYRVVPQPKNHPIECRCGPCERSRIGASIALRGAPVAYKPTKPTPIKDMKCASCGKTYAEHERNDPEFSPYVRCGFDIFTLLDHALMQRAALNVLERAESKGMIKPVDAPTVRRGLLPQNVWSPGPHTTLCVAAQDATETTIRTSTDLEGMWVYLVTPLDDTHLGVVRVQY